MTCVLVTGGTGLIGSNICKQLIEQGDTVRALVRDAEAARGLAELGATLVEGDIADAASVLRAAEGAEAAIHSAAVLGGATQDIDEHWAINHGGAVNVFDAAVRLGMRRVVALNTTTFFDMEDSPLTETSPLHPNPPTDPYTVTKGAAFVEAMRRADEGQDICVAIPGGTYGPAPLAERAMMAPSFNERIVHAVTGAFDSYISFPIPWAYSEDVARVAVKALDRGVRGEMYLAFGRPEDVSGIPEFCNRALDFLGMSHRVEPLGAADVEDPDVAARFGPSLCELARRRFPEPFFRYEHTLERLGHEPVSLDDGVARTCEWLQQQGFM